MKKYILDLEVADNVRLNPSNVLLKLTSSLELPQMRPGQFVEVRVDGSPTTFLRRPISIHFVAPERNEIWLLVQEIGDGTRKLGELKRGDSLNVILPLGNSFTWPSEQVDRKLLLIGGGVGIAPMLYLGAELKKAGFSPVFLLGGRTFNQLLQLDEFAKYGEIYTTTEDGSHGEKGFVTDHSILKSPFDFIYTCGPKPMMKAVANYAKQTQTPCEVSLENTMACGIGACLCCVENTTQGHVCVCTEGPIFNIQKLLW